MKFTEDEIRRITKMLSNESRASISCEMKSNGDIKAEVSGKFCDIIDMCVDIIAHSLNAVGDVASKNNDDFDKFADKASKKIAILPLEIMKKLTEIKKEEMNHE